MHEGRHKVAMDSKREDIHVEHGGMCINSATTYKRDIAQE